MGCMAPDASIAQPQAAGPPDTEAAVAESSGCAAILSVG